MPVAAVPWCPGAAVGAVAAWAPASATVLCGGASPACRHRSLALRRRSPAAPGPGPQFTVGAGPWALNGARPHAGAASPPLLPGASAVTLSPGARVPLPAPGAGASPVTASAVSPAPVCGTPAAAANPAAETAAGCRGVPYDGVRLTSNGLSTPLLPVSAPSHGLLPPLPAPPTATRAVRCAAQPGSRAAPDLACPGTAAKAAAAASATPGAAPSPTGPGAESEAPASPADASDASGGSAHACAPVPAADSVAAAARRHASCARAVCSCSSAAAALLRQRRASESASA